MSRGLINVSSIRSMLTMPSYIFADNRVSLGAKGIYAQICYSKDDILSLNDIAKYANVNEEEISDFINELIDLGYIEKNKISFKLRPKSLSDKTIDERDESEEIKSTIKTTKVHKPNRFDKIYEKVYGSEFSKPVKKVLMDYFVKWLNGEDRFSDRELFPNMVTTQIRKLVEIKNEFALNQKDLIQCIQQSIDKQWFCWVWPLKSTIPSVNNFNKSGTSSGTYTEEERKEVQRKSKERNKRLKIDDES